MARKKWVPGRVVSMRLDELQGAETMDPDTARDVLLFRIQRNLEETGHPFHHKTADGTIVDADPTLEALLARLTDAAPAVPVIRDWYQTEAGRAFLTAEVTRMEHPQSFYVKPASGGRSRKGFWPSVMEDIRERTAEHRPEDREQDAETAELVKSLPAEVRAKDEQIAADILHRREAEPNRVFLVVSEREDGTAVTLDDPTVVEAVKQLAAKAGRDPMQTIVLHDLTPAIEADLYRLITGLDLSEWGVS